MPSYLLERSQVLPIDIETAFAFFRDPSNLGELTPSWLGFRLEFTSDNVVRGGTRIRYRLTLGPFPIRWESLITEWVENARFADEMVRGPYRSWYHVHTFRPHERGVEIRDRVEYSLPFGPLGAVVHWLIVRHQLRVIFDYRRQRAAELFPEPVPVA